MTKVDFGQMEVRHHCIADFEFIAGFNKEARIGAFCPDLAFRILGGARLDGSQARGTHADNTASFGLGLLIFRLLPERCCTTRNA